MNERLIAQARAVKAAAREVGRASDDRRRAVLAHAADTLDTGADEILAVNAHDVANYTESGPGRDRLTLTEARLAGMSGALREIAASPDPLGEVVDEGVRPNGLAVAKVRVPLGVVGVVYENRPNVTSDVAGLCVRSGNAAFLRGSASAQASNAAVAAVFAAALEKEGLPPAAVTLVEDPSHDAVREFMGLSDYIDCLIPRGGPSLIAAMREHARVPYVLDGDGNCHVYVDAAADLDMAVAITVNAKTSRPGVCNAAETLLVHRGVAAAFLPRLADAMPHVQLRADDEARALIPGALAATEDDYAREFLDLVMAVRVVSSLDEAVDHVARYGSGHSEAIVTGDAAAADDWVARVDAAAVLVNASTRFIDGGELGLGGEVG
ncbi:MAG TPA: glutamate-5-semialdehyde dehydrogenase, partial [Acidimicrobiales bacterium]|nr:glutamate-5-semialdehyde dehydrogenase [Acidimicrobiales bacterium]